MVLFEDALKNRGIVKAADLERHAGRRVQMAGVLITGKVVSTKHGDPMEFLTFEDETGLVETTFFPAVYRQFCRMLGRHRPYLLTGKAEEDFGVVTLTVDTATALRG
jgi:DNA polymerase-3 subunit alpha/error-prone DNA polymerase